MARRKPKEVVFYYICSTLLIVFLSFCCLFFRCERATLRCLLSLMGHRVQEKPLKDSHAPHRGRAPWKRAVEADFAAPLVAASQILSSKSPKLLLRFLNCDAGQCISQLLVCNGDQDCEDGLDERNCGRDDSHYSCDLHKTPPNSDFTGRG